MAANIMVGGKDVYKWCRINHTEVYGTNVCSRHVKFLNFPSDIAEHARVFLANGESSSPRLSDRGAYKSKSELYQ